MDEINKAIEQVYTGDLVIDKPMLMVLIYEGIIKEQRIKMGGKLSKMVKQKTPELKALLNANSVNKQTGET